jgi:hypothetical protein
MLPLQSEKVRDDMIQRPNAGHLDIEQTLGFTLGFGLMCALGRPFPHALDR